MKILLLGKNGQVGWELQRSLAPLGKVIALDHDSTDFCGNFTDLAGLAKTVQEIAPDIIVNAAAHTAVDKAETESELAHTINTAAPALLAAEAQKLGAWLVHYSTDYVFDGSKQGAYIEEDKCNPLSAYGRSKWLGEQAIQQSGCHHLILRTSWVYAARGANFAKTMLRLAKERSELRVIDDQTGAPTGAKLLADVTAHALRTLHTQPELGGLYHLSASGATSWHGYARHVLNYARRAGQNITVADDAIFPIPASAYPLPAARPQNSRLDTHKLQAAFGLTLPAWQHGIERMLDEIFV